MASQQIGGFAFRAGSGASRKRQAPAEAGNEPKRQSTGRRQSSGADGQVSQHTEQQTSTQNGVDILDELRHEARTALGSSSTADVRITQMFNAVFDAAKRHGEALNETTLSNLQTVHSSFVAHLSSELVKEFSKSTKKLGRNPKNVANDKRRADGLRRIAEYEKELATWESLASKATSAGAAAPAAGAASPRMREWVGKNAPGRHGKKLMPAIEQTTSKAIEDLDRVATAVRRGSRAASAGKRATGAVAKAAREGISAGVGAKPAVLDDTKALLKNILRG